MPRRRRSGTTASSSNSASSATLRARLKPPALRRPSSARASADARHRQQPGALRARPGLAEARIEAASITAITASRSALSPPWRRELCGCAGRGHHAATSASHRARGRRSGAAAGREARPGSATRRRPRAARRSRSPKPRAATRRAAPDPTTSGARRIAAAASPGARRATGRRRASRHGIEFCTKSAPCPPDSATATLAVALARGDQRQRGKAGRSAPQPIARPCAAARPTRMPVKLPGPQSTRIASGAAAAEQLGDHRHQPLGMAAADHLVALVDAARRPRRTARRSRLRVDVSITRIMGDRCALSTRHAARASQRGSDGLDRLDLGHIMFEQALDAVLERHRRGGAAGAGALQGEEEVPSLKPR